MKRLLLALALQMSAACATLHQAPLEREAPGSGGPDLGYAWRSAAMNEALAQPIDPNNPAFRNVTLNGGTSKIYFSSQGAGSGLFISNISAANAGATAGTSAFKFYTLQALDATDFVFSVGNVSNGTSLFNIAYSGATNINGAVAVTSLTSTSFVSVPSGQRLGYEGNSQGFVSDGVNVTSGRPIVAPNLFNNGTVGTPASGTGVTANYSGAVRTFLHKVTVINTAMTAAPTTDITLAVTPVNSRINRVVADVTQVFTGGALTAVTVTCGNAAGGNQYLLSNSFFTAQNTWGDVIAEMGAGLVDATRADFGTPAAGVPGAITVSCRFTCTTANCNAATQGSATFYVEGVTY